MIENYDHPILMAIAKWRYQPSILSTELEHKNMTNFSFSFIWKKDYLKEKTMLHTSKAIQKSNTSAKIITGDGEFFTEPICKDLNNSLDKIKFLNCLKLANITAVFKKSSRNSKKTYVQHCLLTMLEFFFYISEFSLNKQQIQIVWL